MRVRSMLCSVLVIGTLTLIAATQQQTADIQELENIERSWITARDHSHEWAIQFFDRVLADDAVHILANGRQLSKSDEMRFVRQSPKNRPAGSPSPARVSFEEMRIRLYGDIAIINGTTATHSATGELIRRVRFSDVFQKRSGRWQAINLQETLLEGHL